MARRRFTRLKKLLQKRGLVTAVGDEGGFAPNLEDEHRSGGGHPGGDWRGGI